MKFRRSNSTTPKTFKLPIFIKILDYFAKYFTKLGVNFSQLRLIVLTKLMMDSRIDTNSYDSLNNKRKEGQNKYRSTIIIGLLPGIFFVVLIFLPFPTFSKFGLIFMTMAIMLLLTFIQSFSGLFLDSKDREVFGGRGVDDQTLSVSRLVYLGYYIVLLSLPIVLPAFVATIIKFNLLAAFIYLIMAALLVVVCLTLTTLIYYLILSHFKAERLKKIIGAMQMAMVLIMVAIFYLPSLVSIDSLLLFSNQFKWYYLVTFPAWFAAPVVMLADFTANLTLTSLAILAFVLTFTLLISYRKTSANFEKYLPRLKEESDDSSHRHRYLDWTCGILCHNKLEQSYYQLAYKILQNDQNIKMKIYPFFGLGYLVLIVVLAGFSRDDQAQKMELGRTLLHMKNSNLFSLVSFAPIMGAVFGALSIGQSSQAKAFNVLNSTPSTNPALFYRATLKAYIAKLLLPIGLLSDVLGIFLATPKYYPLLILGNVVTVFAFVLIARLFLRKVPFNSLENPGKNVANSMKGGVGTVIILYLVMGLGAAAYFRPLASLVISVILLAATIFLLYRNTLKVTQFYYE